MSKAYRAATATTMRIIHASQPNRAGQGWLWSALFQLVMLITAALAHLAITLIGMFGVVSAAYMIIEHR